MSATSSQFSHARLSQTLRDVTDAVRKQREDAETLAHGVLYLLVFPLWIVSGLASFAFRGYLLALTWGWFIVSTFAAPTINWKQGIGILFVAGLLQRDGPTSDKKDTAATLWRSIYIGWTANVLTLGFAWLIHHYAR